MAVSDLHGNLPSVDSIKYADILCIAGDLSPIDPSKVWIFWNDFIAWRRVLQNTKVVIIAGNHDASLQDKFLVEELTRENIVYLQDSMAIVNGYKIYGTPWTPRFGTWPWMKLEADLDRAFSNIPQGIDILLSHGPPHGVCDIALDYEKRKLIRCGSTSLHKHVLRSQPRHLFCGHLHINSGSMGKIDKTTVYGTSYVDESYKPTNSIITLDL